MYFVGISTSQPYVMEDPVEEWVIENRLDKNTDRWEEEAWGFLETVSFKIFNDNIFDGVEEDSIQTNINSDHTNFQKFISLFLEYGSIFFDENFKVIERKDWENKVSSFTNCQISICECSPG
jgi:hypothetical protein